MKLRVVMTRFAYIVICGLLLAVLSSASSAQEPIVRTKPRYPDAAVEQRLTGYVFAEFVVGEGGVVKDVDVAESRTKIFDDAVIEAIEKWRYAEDAVGNDLVEKIEFTAADLEAELVSRGEAF